MNGNLVIAGGNIKSQIIYKKFIDYAKGKNIAIIPSASKEPSKALVRYTNLFSDLVSDKDKITGVKLDPYSHETGGWVKSGDDYESFGFMDNIGGIWFTGGDQVKIIMSLLRNDGSETELLKKIKKILYSGGVIGGSSAGAAVMSQIMIGGGTSYGALSFPVCSDYVEYGKMLKPEERGVLLITRGLGFFKYGVIDQHFDERSRIGRLIVALIHENIKKGFGVSEDTAITFNMDTGIIRKIGTGNVTIVDVSNTKEVKMGNLSKITDVKINFLHEDDFYNAYEDKFYSASKNPSYCNNCTTYILPDINASRGLKEYTNQFDNILYEIKMHIENENTNESTCSQFTRENIILDISPVLNAGHKT